jgi:superfamily II DNA or RNA helicase
MNKKAIIKIEDEVNVRISGLELSERKTLMKLFSFDVPGARYLPAVRLGRWNGKTSFFSIGGASYVNLLEEIIPVIDNAGYDIELEDSRQYSTTFNFATVSAETFKHKNWPKGHPVEGQPVVLRDYQIELVNNFLSNPQCLQQAATGAGKTLVTAALSYSIENYGRSIIIVPNVSLVTQTEKDYINLGLDVGVYYGARKEYGKTHTICTWQSLNAMLKNTKAGEAEVTITEFLENVVCVICDEVHGAKAAALKELLTGVLGTVPIRWGLTGTVPKEKMDAITLKICFGNVINYLPASELQEQGVLAKCHVNIVQLQDNVEYKDYQSELKYLLENEERLNVIGNLINKLKVTGNTLVLVDRIAAGKELESRIPDSVFVSGATKVTNRQDEYDKIAVNSGLVLLATYQVAAVGINLPRIFNVVLIEPGKSFVRTIQSIGRGLRMAPDKDHVEIYDITSNCKFSKRHLTQRKSFYNEAKYDFTVEKLSYRTK